MLSLHFLSIMIILLRYSRTPWLSYLMILQFFCSQTSQSQGTLLLFNRSIMSHSLWPNGLSMPDFPDIPYLPDWSNSCPVSQWSHPTISSSVNLFSSCHQSLTASRSFPVSWLFISGGQTTGASASASVLPMNIQDWFPLALTGLILQSKGLSRIFSNTTLQKHQFFSTQLSFWSNSHIHTWLLEKPWLGLDRPLGGRRRGRGWDKLGK